MPLETSAAAGYLVNIGVVGIAGTLFGLPLDALILGGLTGAVVQGFSFIAYAALHGIALNYIIKSFFETY